MVGEFGKFGRYIEALFNEHKFVRRVTMAIVLFMDVAILRYSIGATGTQMTENQRLVFLGLIGLNAVFIGLYQWDRMRDSG